MVENKTVLLIGGNKRALTRAKEVGLYTINILEKDGVKKELEECADETVVIETYNDLDEIEHVAKKIMEERPFHCAISLSEYGLLPAAHINEVFHLRGTSVETVHLLREKGIMRKFLLENNISPVKYRVGKDIKDIEAFMDEINDTFILKPENGAGSFQIHKISNRDDIKNAWDSIQKAHVEKFIMEEYLDGLEVSVEAFSFGGEHKIINITDKLINEDFIEIGHSVPSRHPEEICSDIAALVTEFLTAINLKDGPSHTEVKLTAKGPRIVESHNRIGGDNITELVKIATGIDIVKYTFEWAYGLKGKLEGTVSYNCAAAIRFIVPNPGTITKIKGTEKVLEETCLEELSIHLNVGDTVKHVNHSLDRAGYIIANGRDAKEAMDNCQRLLSMLEIETLA